MEMNFESDISGKLHGMNNEELAEILRSLLHDEDEISALVAGKLDREASESPEYAAFRKSISSEIDYVTDETEGNEEDDLLTDAIFSDDYSHLHPAGMDDFCSRIRKALEDTVSSACPYDGFRSVLLCSRMCHNTGHWKCKAVISEMEKEYLPGILRKIFYSLPEKDKESVLSWAMDNEEDMPMHDKGYSILASSFLACIDDRRSLRLLVRLRLRRLESESYFSYDAFEKVQEAMMRLRDWKGLEELFSRYPEESIVLRARGDMFMKRRMYDEAFRSYMEYHAMLVEDEDYPELDELLEFLDRNISRFSDVDALIRIYEDDIFHHRMPMLDHIQTFYRLLPDDRKPEIRERLESYLSPRDDRFLLRAFGSDDEIADLYRNGKVSRKDLHEFLEYLVIDAKSFSRTRRNIRYYASLLEECYGNILVYDDLEYVRYIDDAFDILMTDMGKPGRDEGERILESMPEYTAFYDEVYEDMKDYSWFEAKKKGNDI